MNNKDKVLHLLSKLKVEELEEVQTNISALLNFQGYSVYSVTKAKTKINLEIDKHDWFIRAVMEYAVSKGWCSKNEVSLYIQNKALSLVTNYKSDSKEMRLNLKKRLRLADGLKLTSNQWDAIGPKLVKILIRYLTAEHSRNVDKGIKSEGPLFIDAYLLLENVGKMIAAIDHELPGYIDCGAFAVLVPKQ